MGSNTQDVGYKSMEVVNFLKECETCHQYFISVARLVLHCLLHHFRLSSLMCSCGKSFDNKGVFNLHIERYHCGYHNLFHSGRAQVRASTRLNSFNFSLTVNCLLLFFYVSLYIFSLQDTSAVIINVMS